ncbi:hypothetical protein AV540_00455 [Brevibacillus parabrevis]|uniref:hypothetical protein n=1 Tax=Brevibacillus parabrevis TaxID=54914 RepID=UPI0007AB3B78|nr:hypothetical protein [Brevibacillus parabrevis]KZE51479.1 hypothetical protein AV540_00455 [Brevibacillus parabrevis]
MFTKTATSEETYYEIFRSFEVWWTSLIGGFSLERSISSLVRELYDHVVDYVTQHAIVPAKSLRLSLIFIYDECRLAEKAAFSYFAIVPFPDFFLAYKKVVTQLEKNMAEA